MTVNGCWCVPRSLAMYWAPSSAASGRPLLRHSVISADVGVVADDLAEEVVRREEDQPAAEVRGSLR